MTLLLAVLAGCAQGREVVPVPAAMRATFKLSDFYAKAVDAGGFPIVASAKVSDTALKEAAYLIDRMLDRRDDLRAALAKNNVRFSVMAAEEMTTDLPEHSDLKPKDWWDRRARGLGATDARPAVSCGEENLLCSPGDPYSAENILIHEFAHAIHERGLNTVDPKFAGELKRIFNAGRSKGLWKGKYAGKNRNEYWAEGVQSWFDTNRENDHDHNHVNTRAELKEYDPELATLVESIFGDREWRYVRPADRKEPGHFRGYDAAKAKKFAWPERLRNVDISKDP